MSAFIYVGLTSFSIPTVGTAAYKIINVICTLSSVKTGLTQTLINIFLAKSSPVSRWALTLEAIDLVQALALVETRVGGALVDINLTLGTVGSRRTMALKK
jgi:hypothetical protein